MMLDRQCPKEPRRVVEGPPRRDCYRGYAIFIYPDGTAQSNYRRFNTAWSAIMFIDERLAP